MGTLPPIPPVPRPSKPWVVKTDSGRIECRYGYDAATPGQLIVIRPSECIAPLRGTPPSADFQSVQEFLRSNIGLSCAHPQACDYCRRIFADDSTQCHSCGAPRRLIR